MDKFILKTKERKKLLGTDVFQGFHAHVFKTKGHSQDLHLIATKRKFRYQKRTQQEKNQANWTHRVFDIEAFGPLDKSPR